tara:strand:- start:1432 stop:3876 length:2445 start_codon:yes stop_codon:yes gene_type:complete
MKALQTRKINTVNSQEFEQGKFKLNSNDAQLFKILRSQIYENKILAVVREYSCNALDAHIEAGVPDKPIEVTLPNNLNPYFTVRDFGKGLDDEGIFDIYATYGKSTKRHTNDQIGQLGLGCKSGFAYSNNFLVVSYCNKKKTIYNCFIDESEIGQISKMSSEPSTEPNGIEIRVNVLEDDHNTFVSEARNYFKFWVDNRPIIKGINDSEFWGDAKFGELIIEGTGWAIYENNNRSVAVMGNVPYSVNSNSMGYDYNSLETGIIDCGVIMDFKIGDLSMTASREGLEYNDISKNSIESRLKLIIKELPSILSKKFISCKTMWEAKLLFNQVFSHGGIGRKFSKLLKSSTTKGIDIEWNGKKITDSNYSFTDNSREDIKIWHFHKSHGGKRVKNDDGRHINVDSESIVVVDDLDVAQGRMNRIAPLLEEFDGKKEQKGITDKLWKNVYLVKAVSKLGRKQLKQKGLDCPHEVKLSKLNKYILRDIYPSNSTVKGGSGHIKNSKHSRKVFVFDKDFEGSRHETCRSSFFKVDSLDFNDKAEKVYIEVDKFFVQTPSDDLMYGGSPETHPRDFDDLLKELKSVGIKVPKIYYMKPVFFEKAQKNSTWIHFKDFYKREVEAHLKKGKLLNNLYNQTSLLLQDQHLSGCELSILNELPKSKILQKEDSPFFNLLEARSKLNSIKKETFKTLLKLSKNLFPKSLEKKANQPNGYYRYGSYYSHSDRDIHKLFLKYLKLLAKKNNTKLEFTFNLKDMFNECIDRYPLLHRVSTMGGRQEMKGKPWVKEVLDMVNIYDVTFVSKKKLAETKKSVDKKGELVHT